MGLPQPSEALTASAGKPSVCASEYRFDVIGSAQPHAEGPQQPVLVLPFVTASAIAPYLLRTSCCTSDITHLLDRICPYAYAKATFDVIYMSRRI